MDTYWSCFGVETEIPWPDKELKVEYLGLEYVLRPESENNAPSVAFEHGTKGVSQEDAITAARRFLSALCWVEGHGVTDTFWIGGPIPYGIGKSGGWSGKSIGFEVIYLPVPTDDRQKLALAIYREALSTNTKPYKFLGFSRIINIIADKGPDQKKWINANLVNVTGEDAKNLITELQASKGDVGEHLYNSGRCAVAHAFGSPVVDPDSSIDLRRVVKEIPLMRALAEVVIERELKIKSHDTFVKEHLYELEGFKRRLSKNIMDEVLKAEKRIVDPKEVGLELEIGIRGKPSYAGMNHMIVEKAGMKDKSLDLLLASKDSSIHMLFGIRLGDERMFIDPYRGFRINDDNTKSAATSIQGFLKFMKDLLSNGRPQVKAVDTGEVLGYGEHFIGMNVDLRATIDNWDKQIAELDEQIAKREK